MSDVIRINALTYTYPGASPPALCEVSLAVRPGEFVLLSGPSGSGKSTLLRALNGLVPHFTGGRITGRIVVDGLDPVRAGPSQMSRSIGMVFQDPESQFVVDRVEDEVAFALENAAVPRAEMRARVDDVLQRVAMAQMRDRAIGALSGGEQQRVAIASALVLRPRVLALDEPTSQLDDESAEAVLGAVAQINRDHGLTVVLSEHRLERAQSFASRIVRLEEGRVVEDEPAPAHPATANGLQTHGPRPNGLGQVRLSVDRLAAGYGDMAVLRDATLIVRAGEIVALMGRNGSGKSTLLKAIVGLIAPARGRIDVDGRNIAGRDTADICRDVAYLPQNPNALLFADTVQDELNITRRNHGLPAFTPDEAVRVLDRLGVAGYAQRYPRDLSVGERQRVALGAVASARPALLLLDEPTRGLDAGSKQVLATVLRRYASDGAGVLLVTHDRPLIEACADRVLALRDGALTQLQT
jgi:energy-coupling factor transport system ATP-binding protein